MSHRPGSRNRTTSRTTWRVGCQTILGTGQHLSLCVSAVVRWPLHRLDRGARNQPECADATAPTGGAFPLYRATLGAEEGGLASARGKLLNRVVSDSFGFGGGERGPQTDARACSRTLSLVNGASQLNSGGCLRSWETMYGNVQTVMGRDAHRLFGARHLGAWHCRACHQHQNRYRWSLPITSSRRGQCSGQTADAGH